MLEDVKNFIESALKTEKSWLCIAIITLLCSLSLFALGYTPRITGDLDYSWELSLHEFFATKKQFGTEMIFSYGPYGFLFTKLYHPKTHWLTNISWLFFALVFWWSSFYIAYKLIKNKLFIFIWFFALFFVFCDSHSSDNIFACFFIFFLTLNFYIKDKLSVYNNIILTFTITLIGLIKFSFFSITLPIIILVSINDLVNKKKPLSFITFSISTIFLWLLAGQNLSLFPSYIKNSLDIAYYYNYAMTPAYSASSVELTNLIFVFVFLSLITFVTTWQKEKARGVFWSLSFLYFIFIIIKAGYGRFDLAHIIPNNGTLCIVALFYLIISFEEEQKAYLKFTAFTTMLLMLLLFQSSLQNLAYNNLTRNISKNGYIILANIKQFWSVATRKTNLQQNYNAEMERLRQEFPLPPLTGSVDLYSYSQMVVLAHNFEYKSRPVFQSYKAYSPFFAETNAKYLSNRGSKNVLFNCETIDHRYPSLDDSLSWPELLTKYDLKDISPKSQFLILERSKTPKTYSFTSETTVETTFNQAIDVPKTSEALVWVKIDIGYSSSGNIFSKVYKPAPVYLQVTTEDNKEAKYLIPTPMAKTGFLLSPLIKNNLSFAKLFTNQIATDQWTKELSDSEVKSIKIILLDNEHLWQFSPKINISFSYLTFSNPNSQP